MKRIMKLLSLSALVCDFGALSINSVPSVKGARAQDYTYEVGYARTNFESHLTPDSGWSINYNALYFELDPAKASTAPFNSDWSLRYKPTTYDAIRLVRGGVTYDVANPDAEMIVKLSETKCELQTWAMNGRLPSEMQPFAIQHNDQIIIDGSFTNSKADSGNVHTLVISETTFLCTFGRTINDKVESYFIALPQTIVDVDNSKANVSTNAWWFLFDINGLSEDDAPREVTAGGSDRAFYYPTSSECFYLDGQPFARATKGGLWRWDAGQYNWYVTVNDDIQGILSHMQVGSIIVLDGLFTYYGDILSLDNFGRMGLRFHMLAFQKTGEGNGAYEKINLVDYLSDTLHSQFDVGDFIQADQDAATAALEAFDNNIALQANTRSCYELYDEAALALSALTLDEAALNAAKQQGIQDISNYANLDNYDEDEQTTINSYITQYTSLINAATKRIQVLNYVADFKDLVDEIITTVQKMIAKVNNHESGYEQYLMSSDDVTLYDLGFDEDVVFHGDENQRKEDVNTYIQEQNIHNTFAPSADNLDGNVNFHFTYKPNATPSAGVNACITLRGVAYAGYKIAMDTINRSCYIERLNSGESGQLMGGTDPVFENGQTYEMSVGAIDLINDIGKTWIYIKINGDFAYSKVIDSLLICTNPRVSISPNGDATAGTYEGTAAIGLPSNVNAPIEGLYAGRLVYSEGDKNEIHATLDENSLPSNKEGLEVSYAARPETVQLIRNDVPTNVGKVDEPVLKKINDTEYIFDVSKCAEVQDGDIIYISGTFYYYSETDHAKTAFTISASRFKYNASSKAWTPILTLEEAKTDVSKKLDGVADLSKYDKAEQTTINNLIKEGKDKISKATTVEEVDSIYATYKGKVDEVKTTFRKYQDAGIEAVNAYKADNLADYRQDEKDEIASLKKEAVEAINVAKTNDEVDEVVANLMDDIDDLMTDADYDKIELEDAIKDGRQEIYDFYAAIDTTGLSEAQIAALEKDTQDAMAAVKAATSIEEVERIVKEFKDSHSQLSPDTPDQPDQPDDPDTPDQPDQPDDPDTPEPTPSKKGGCKSSIVSCGSMIVFAIAMGGLLIVLRQAYKNKKKED